MITLADIQRSLQTADDWQKKGQPSWVQKCLNSALLGYLQLAVNEHDDPAGGVAWLESQNVGSLLQRRLDSGKILAAEVDAGRLPASGLDFRYNPLAFAHCAWCLRLFPLGEEFLLLDQRSDVVKLGTPFWNEYARGMSALIRREAFQSAAGLKLKDLEKYWVAYVRFMEAACTGRGLGSALAELDQQFALRNADKKIKQDFLQIEGSGQHPVKWDFRRHGLVTYLASR